MSSSGADPTGHSSRSTKRVLIVDDDQDTRASMSDLLQENGYDVLEAGEAREALDHLIHQPDPAVILLDGNLPQMSGWELLAIIKRYSRLARIPVILVSGAEPQPEALSAGTVVAFLQKPFDQADLMSILAKLVR